ITSQAATKSTPAPPSSSSRPMPRRPASASSRQSGRSNGPSGAAACSISLRRSWVTRSVKIRPASSRTASCSSLYEKSICRSLFSVRSAGPGHAEAEDANEVALDLVGAAPEGQDDDGAGLHLEPAGKDRSGRAAREIAGLAHNFEQGTDGPQIELRAEYLDR